ncbi:hypothetical protein [Actinomadura gamaensis]|uniref:DUF3558 domain-containing protein n=1 Tax=Actinomadura gamaensis TaxID=1763541 RepID=A0ABV9U4F2_9ACTN
MSGSHRSGGHRASRSGEYRSFSGDHRTASGDPAPYAVPGGRPADEYVGRSGERAPRPVQYGARNTEYGSPGSEYGVPSAEYRTRSSEYNTPGAEYGPHTGASIPRATEYGVPSGEYGTPSGEYGTPSGEYGARSGASSPRGTEYGARSGEYAGRSGEYAGRSGAYGARSGEYAGQSGGYGTRSGEFRTRSGSHRVVRERRRGRRVVAVLAGVAAGAGACALAALVIISGLGGHDRGSSGQIVGSTAQTPAARAEKTAVPDACTLLDPKIADRLAPNAERGPADNYASSDRQNQCVWGAYSGEHRRQLSVEMRALPGTQSQSPTDAARGAFASERSADESGKALLPGQEITDKIRPNGLGDEAYVVYSVDKGQGSGSAVANVRVGNVLVTVHFSGSDGNDPLATDAAVSGAQDAARSVIGALNQS